MIIAFPGMLDGLMQEILISSTRKNRHRVANIVFPLHNTIPNGIHPSTWLFRYSIICMNHIPDSCLVSYEKWPTNFITVQFHTFILHSATTTARDYEKRSNNTYSHDAPSCRGITSANFCANKF
uniref:Glucuronosyltransferase n=1 Tax=Parascaris univalens TaxID=6257 RepID=A0A915B8X4_PARUN